jgi:hypothetical protein
MLSFYVPNFVLILGWNYVKLPHLGKNGPELRAVQLPRDNKSIPV